MTKTPVMVTLLPSSDVDLARWAMHLFDKPYVERPHAPIFHIFALKWHGMGKMASPLLLKEGQKYPGVDAILDFYEPQIAPEMRLRPDAEKEPTLAKEVDALQHSARFEMGNGTVLWAYFHFLQHRSVVWPSLTTGIPAWEKALMRFGYPKIKKMMYEGLKLDQAAADAALETVRKAWDETDERLADGRAYLAGDRLTLADLAFATSGGPMVLAKGYGGHLPAFEDCPSNMQKIFSELSARPSGQFIQRMYDLHR